MGSITVSIGKGKDAPSVVLPFPEPSTFDDPQWERWNCSEADICALAVRQVRVDWANGGGREALREAVKAFPKQPDKWLAPVKAHLDAWKRGVQRTAKKQVIDLRGTKFSADQIAGIQAANPSATILHD